MANECDPPSVTPCVISADRAPARDETVGDLKLAAISFGEDAAKLSCGPLERPLTPGVGTPRKPVTIGKATIVETGPERSRLARYPLAAKK